MILSYIVRQRIVIIHQTSCVVSPEGRLTTLGDHPFTATMSQLKTLSLVAQGIPHKEIARKTGLAPGTIRNRLESLRGSNGGESTVSLVARALEFGLIHPNGRN